MPSVDEEDLQFDENGNRIVQDIDGAEPAEGFEENLRTTTIPAHAKAQAANAKGAKGIEWEYAVKLSSTRWKCNACQETYGGGATRVRSVSFVAKALPL